MVYNLEGLWGLVWWGRYMELSIWWRSGLFRDLYWYDKRLLLEMMGRFSGERWRRFMEAHGSLELVGGMVRMRMVELGVGWQLDMWRLGWYVRGGYYVKFLRGHGGEQAANVRRRRRVYFREMRRMMPVWMYRGRV